jgi:hypothetical protein
VRARRRARVLRASLLAVLLAGAPAAGPAGAGGATGPQGPGGATERLRIIVETDAGGDPDDEQSLVRFLLYVNEWDVEAIIANRLEARAGENRNPVRTGLGIVKAMVDAYAACHPRLVRHDPRYPDPAELRRRCVAGYEDTPGGVERIMAAVDGPDPRPVWFLNWGTDRGSAPSSLRRALDQVRRERGPEGYARFKRRLRLSSYDAFGEHTAAIEPPFPLWVDTFRPEKDGKRWYHRFSALTATAGGFDIERDVRRGHGPLGALYPTNTTHPQKEGDTMAFLYLVPTGMNDPAEPGIGSWAGRYGPAAHAAGKPYYWASEEDAFAGTTSRDNTLRRWAAALQNDFRARLDWCVEDPQSANHPPRPEVEGELEREVAAGDEVILSAAGSTDPDGDRLRFEWLHYPEAAGERGPPLEIRGAAGPQASLTAPASAPAAAPAPQRAVHVILSVTDDGSPPLTRYRRVVLRVRPERAR